MQSPSTPPPLPGHIVLDEAAAFLKRFVVFPSAAAADACALWACHSHAVNAFSATPRLAFLSDEPGSGKTKAMELTGMLSHDGVLEVDPTAPAMIAMLSQRQPTILLDEVDTVFGTHGGASHRSLRSILNSGYRAGSSVTRRHGGGYQQDSIYGAVAFAGLGTLPAALLTRCIVVKMRPKRPEESAETFMHRVHAPIAIAIGEALGSWARSVALDLAGAWPDPVAGVENRNAEVWEALLAIGDQAGGGWGGPTGRARRACLELVRGNESEPVKSPGQRLLDDLRAVWKVSDGNLPTAELIRRLYDVPASPWRSLWPEAAAPREMSALLAPFGVRPSKIRQGEKTMQGYKLADLQAIWPPVLAIAPVPDDSDDVPDDSASDLHVPDVLDVPDFAEETPAVVSAPRNTPRTRNTRRATADKGA
jgi:Protein of unknown function (DUF3631)